MSVLFFPLSLSLSLSSSQLKDDYAEKLTALADEIKNEGLAIRKRQVLEMNDLDDAICAVQRQRQQEAIIVIQEYEQKGNK